MAKQVQFMVRLPPELLQSLDLLAAAKSAPGLTLTRTHMVRIAVAEYVARELAKPAVE